jgi:hypothetical protein
VGSEALSHLISNDLDESGAVPDYYYFFACLLSLLSIQCFISIDTLVTFYYYSDYSTKNKKKSDFNFFVLIRTIQLTI